MHKLYVWITGIAIVASMSFGLAQQTADTILYNGKVLTVDANFSRVQAVAVRGNRIAAVGTDDEILRLAGPNTLRIDLKGRTVTPGLINTHVHLEGVGAYARELGALKTRVFPLNVRGLTDKDDVLQQMKDVVAAFKIPPGEWLYFSPNWTANQASLIFNDLNAKELDKATPNNPIVMRVGVSVDNNQMMNSMALAEMWRKYGDFIETYGRYWIDASGQPAGIVEAPASRIVWGDPEWGLLPKPEDAGPYFRKILIESWSSLGVTMISGGINAGSVETYQWLDSRGEMPLRYAYGAMSGFHPGADMKDFQLGAGTHNVFIASLSPRATDGGGVRMCVSLERNNEAIAQAAAAIPDSSDMNRVAAAWWPLGQCSMDIEYGGGGGTNSKGGRIQANYFADWYRQVGTAGLRAANTHASGDKSVTMMIDVWEGIDRVRPGAVKGWAIDHCYLIKPSDLPRAARLGLMFSCNPNTAISSDPDRGARSMLVAYGEEVLHTYASPFKSMVDSGINVSLEVEGGLTWWGAVETMITRLDHEGKVWGPDQRVDRQTALKIATQNGANYVLKGDQLGSLEAGKFADLVILDRDYMTMPELEISEMRPLMTMMGGQIIFLRTDFSNEYNLKPVGAEISTHEALRERRPSGGE